MIRKGAPSARGGEGRECELLGIHGGLNADVRMAIVITLSPFDDPVTARHDMPRAHTPA